MSLNEHRCDCTFPVNEILDRDSGLSPLTSPKSSENEIIGLEPIPTKTSKMRRLRRAVESEDPALNDKFVSLSFLLESQLKENFFNPMQSFFLNGPIPASFSLFLSFLCYTIDG